MQESVQDTEWQGVLKTPLWPELSGGERLGFDAPRAAEARPAHASIFRALVARLHRLLFSSHPTLERPIECAAPGSNMCMTEIQATWTPLLFLSGVVAAPAAHLTASQITSAL